MITADLRTAGDPRIPELDLRVRYREAFHLAPADGLIDGDIVDVDTAFGPMRGRVGDLRNQFPDLLRSPACVVRCG